MWKLTWDVHGVLAKVRGEDEGEVGACAKDQESRCERPKESCGSGSQEDNGRGQSLTKCNLCIPVSENGKAAEK